MALDSSALQTLVESKLTAAGFDLTKAPATSLMAQAIAEAVVEHVTANAQVIVSGGSSAGTYSVS